MKILTLILFFISFAFSSTQNVSLVNDIKSVIQKEEYISLAINKYILQTGKVPKKNDNTLDWDKLLTKDYLGINFNRYNPITKQDMVVTFNSKNNAFIQGVFEKESGYKNEYNYLYNFYTNNIFRVNTIPPKSTSKTELLKGSQILYNKIQKEIVSTINENKYKIFLPTQSCEIGNYYYELINGSLVYKYCKTANSSIEVYQESPIYLDNLDDLKYIKAETGSKAYIKDGISWYEYYYEGNGSWIPVGTGRTTGQINDNISIEDRILSYIPDSKDLVLRRDGGCMLANGDIFCWGNNKYKKAGIENYGQLDKSLKADYVNTPVMLKVQIEDSIQNSKKWYNNPYRVKFEKMAMNSTNVCGISPIFNYFEGTQKKFGGDLYCNGQITQLYFENVSTAVSETSILGKNKFFGWGKSDKTDDAPKTIKVSEDGGPAELNSSGNELTYERDEIYLTDIVMVEDTIAVLSDTGDIYTIGRNYNGALGIGSNDKFINQLTPQKVKNPNGVLFKKIFALRDIATFGALDSNNYFYIWGERPKGVVYNEPTIVSHSLKFNPDGIFTNSKDFLLKGVDNKFYRTKNSIDLASVSEIPSTAISASIYDSDSTQLYVYATENMVLKGSNSFLVCKMSNGSDCSDNTDKAIFKTALDELNAMTNKFNGKDYANFANVSIYQLDTVKKEIIENFENRSSAGWIGSYNNYQGNENKCPSNSAGDSIRIETVNNNGDTTRIVPTTFLGRFSIGDNNCTDNDGHSWIEKTFDIGYEYRNNEVELEFDFYEIDSWDYEKFFVTINGDKVVEDSFVHDNHSVFTDDNDSGQYLQPLGTSGIYHSDGDEAYRYKIKAKVDSNGKLKVRFTTRGLVPGEPNYYSNARAQPRSDESWGIDNIRIKVKETSKIFVCAMTGMGASSQLYCWGNVGRAMPILSTSLYDVAKISTINKLFITQESEKNSRMSFIYFNDNGDSDSGNLFLKYPTYIGGFDYPFYFK